MDRSRFSHDVTVEASHIDELGHVNNVVYLQFMEGVARAHASSVGMGLEVLSTLRCVPVARQSTIKYLKPTFLGDVLTIETRIFKVQGARAWRAYELRRGDELVASGETEWVWLDPVRQRPRAAAPEVLAAFGVPAS
ncbi:acyl-CoA thioesterase [Deinococcus yavapaiensis]|uniref:Acyl-CoA thioester hydrolase n=1 Tax=Deinococcus yavapaiensis KR-236 TaxID=694435 RepID=A0A318SG72_9DEIO|nr:thioesterase family protein [Deinococcus yavapaiensis]PYE53051.1 acyl-CoA thioester hydrolase [Deinococcus yavapaiensis KR-236]